MKYTEKTYKRSRADKAVGFDDDYRFVLTGKGAFGIQSGYEGAYIPTRLCQRLVDFLRKHGAAK